ncbi:MAG: TauD/TfdA family dioxygenase [Gammaproteobacteria bacterium]|nr:TauD/TfdA family dioxygenase [Gammaproteobacteria bacterium]
MTVKPSPADRAADAHFLTAAVIADPARYRRWRADKLARARRWAAQSPVDIADPAQLTAAELAALRARVEAVNFALYRVGGAAAAVDHAALKRLCRQVGLTRLATNPFSAPSGISEICVVDGVAGDATVAGATATAATDNAGATTVAPAATVAGTVAGAVTDADGANAGATTVANPVAAGTVANPAARYIPYTDRALGWHTDGYYHPPQRRIRAFALHTLRAAPSGGENRLLDHEILYLLLRDRDPALAAGLFAADALTIPPGLGAGGGARAAQTGPVFWFAAGRLQMRLTLRPRHAQWKASTRAAAAGIKAILDDPESPFVTTRRLRAGEGILCNNIPHNRAAFTRPPAGHPGRLTLRARFYDCITIDA